METTDSDDIRIMKQYMATACPRPPMYTVDNETGALQLPCTPDDLADFMVHLGINPEKTLLYSLQVYQENLKAWRADHITSPKLPSPVIVHNIVHRVVLISEAVPGTTTAQQDDVQFYDELVSMDDFQQPSQALPTNIRTQRIRPSFAAISQLRHCLWPLWPMTKMRKFAAVEVQFAPPFCVVISIQGSGHLECKGGASLLATYLAIELVLAYLRDTAHLTFKVQNDGIKNIVSTCHFDFVLSPQRMCEAMPGPCRMATKSAFPGASYALNICHADEDYTTNEPRQGKMRFFNKSNAILVGTQTIKDTLVAFEMFYMISRPICVQN